MSRPVGVVRLAALAVAACAVAGCNDSVKQKTYPASGRVLVDGKPVPGAMIVFHPVDPSAFKWDERPQGRSDTDGKFEVFTYQTGDGAPAGAYRVAIAVVATGDDDGNDQVRRARGRVAVPAKYGHQDKSGLTAKVEKGPTTLPPFDLAAK